MRILAIGGVLAAGLLLSPTFSAGVGPPPSAAIQTPVEAAMPVAERICVVAVQAFLEGRDPPVIDPALEEYGALLEKLPFDTFQPVTVVEQEAPYGSETAFPVNDAYCFYVTPKTWRPDDSLLEMDARVEMRSDGKSVDALAASARLAAGGSLLFRGLKLPPGELVFIITLRQREEAAGRERTPESERGDDQQSESQDRPEESSDQEPENQSDSQAEEQTEAENAIQEPESPENEDTTSATDHAKTADGPERPENVQHIEAILRSLEEMDRSEQQRLRQHRDKRETREEWW